MQKYDTTCGSPAFAKINVAAPKLLKNPAQKTPKLLTPLLSGEGDFSF